ncbi:MAG: response regulator [Puia sp.]|nr:response regulator [Puia sp.]
MELKNGPIIFVVEDNLFYQHLVAKELESIGAELYFYTNGEACLRELHRSPSVIVMDYNLDGELNGLDTLQKVRSISPDVYAILFSSQKGLNTKDIFVKYGSFDFLEKNNLSFRILKQMVICAIEEPGLI